MDLQLTHRCNLRCTYCYAASRDTIDAFRTDLPEELADSAVEFLLESSRDTPRLRLYLWGGEPFLRTDLIKRIATRAHMGAKRKNKALSIVVPTNATLLNDEALSLVDDCNLGLSLSLDGAPEAYEARRTAGGKNGWHLVGPGLERLFARHKGKLPSVRMTITPNRANCFFEDLKYVLDMGFRQIAFMPASGVAWRPDAIRDLDDQLTKVADHFAAWIREGRPDPPYYHSLLPRLAALWIEEKTGCFPKRNATCGAGNTLIAVDTSGDIYPCHRFMSRASPLPDVKLGNLETGIADTRVRRALESIGPDESGIRCATCDKRLECGRICIALNYAASGDVICVSDENCLINERMQKAAKKIHTLLVHVPQYSAYVDPYLNCDPDERMLPLLAAFQTDSEQILDRAMALLESPGRGEEFER